jgi:hypothetical protein
MLTNNEEVQQNWMEMGQGSSGGIRVACASDALDNSMLFRNRKKQASIDLETLQRLIDQDAPSHTGRDDPAQLTRFCSVDTDDIPKLQLLVQKKALTSSGGNWGRVCVADKTNQMYPKGLVAINAAKADLFYDCVNTSNLAAEGKKAELEKEDPKAAASDIATEVEKTRTDAFNECENIKKSRIDACKATHGDWIDNVCRCSGDDEVGNNGRCVKITENVYEKAVFDEAGAKKFETTYNVKKR